MPAFDFITNRGFRESLENDYAELGVALKNGAPKAVLVLSGSMIEAVLTDHLVANRYKHSSGKSPLEMSFAQLIEACSETGALSDTAKDLCSAVKGYRNLIHPGRKLRLKETVDLHRARAAEALVEIICEEMGRARSETQGPTAEQVVTKLETDSTAITILGHLLDEMSEDELERLVLEALPDRYRQLVAQGDDFGVDADAATRSLGECYDLALSKAPDAARKKAATKLAGVVRSESEYFVLSFEDAFLRGAQLEHMSQHDRDLVKDHFLGRMKVMSDFTFRSARGFGPYLVPSDIISFYDPLIRSWASGNPDAEHSRELAVDTWRAESPECDAQLLQRLDEWITHYKRTEKHNAASRTQELRDHFDPPTDDDIPF